jgi:hypothetical protein
VVEVKGEGILDITTWEQEGSITVHLVNFTNPMMMKGPFRELLPVGEQTVKIKLPQSKNVKKVKLLVSGKELKYNISKDTLELTIQSILDHEVIAVDLA